MAELAFISIYRLVQPVGRKTHNIFMVEPVRDHPEYVIKTLKKLKRRLHKQDKAQKSRNKIW